MAGHGPPRKLDEVRARRNKDHVATTTLYRTPTPQPELPSSVEWHMQTLLWWHMWGQSELSEDFTDAEWSYLIDTALLHNEFWNGEFKLAAELRLRSAKFGITPEDRHRLRIVVLTAQEGEERAKKGPDSSGSRGRYQNPPKAG